MNQQTDRWIRRLQGIALVTVMILLTMQIVGGLTPFVVHPDIFTGGLGIVTACIIGCCILLVFGNRWWGHA